MSSCPPVGRRTKKPEATDRSFGARLVRLRTEMLCLTQEEMVDWLTQKGTIISHRTLQRWEKNYSSPTGIERRIIESILEVRNF